MQIIVKGRHYFEAIKGTDEEAVIFDSRRVISVNSVRIPEEPPFSRKYWDAENLLILRFDDADDPDELLFEGDRLMIQRVGNPVFF